MTGTAVVLCVWTALLGGPVVAAEKDKPLSAVETMTRPLTRPVISGPLRTALEQYQKLVGVRVKVDWDTLARRGVKETDKVTVKVPRATGEQLLDLMLIQISQKGYPLGWYIDQNVVRVTTQIRVLRRSRVPVWLARAGRVRPVSRRAVGRPVIGRIELDFDRTALEDVLTYFREISGLNLHVNWRSLELIGVGRQTEVTIKVSRLTLTHALTLVTDGLSTSSSKLERIYWLIDEGVVVIATGAALNTGLRTRIYDVADLLLVVPNFQAPDVELGNREDTDQTSAGGLFGETTRSEVAEAEESPAAQRQRLQQNLIDAIKDSIGQDMWQPIGPGSIRLLGSRLVISQTPLGFKLLAESARPQ